MFETLVINGQYVSASRLAIGLLHLAASRGDTQAQLALAIRYRHGKQKQRSNMYTDHQVDACYIHTTQALV